MSQGRRVPPSWIGMPPLFRLNLRPCTQTFVVGITKTSDGPSQVSTVSAFLVVFTLVHFCGLYIHVRGTGVTIFLWRGTASQTTPRHASGASAQIEQGNFVKIIVMLPTYLWFLLCPRYLFNGQAYAFTFTLRLGNSPSSAYVRVQPISAVTDR